MGILPIKKYLIVKCKLQQVHTSKNLFCFHKRFLTFFVKTFWETFSKPTTHCQQTWYVLQQKQFNYFPYNSKPSQAKLQPFSYHHHLTIRKYKRRGAFDDRKKKIFHLLAVPLCERSQRFSLKLVTTSLLPSPKNRFAGAFLGLLSLKCRRLSTLWW